MRIYVHVFTEHNEEINYNENLYIYDVVLEISMTVPFD